MNVLAATGEREDDIAQRKAEVSVYRICSDLLKYFLRKSL